MFFMQRVKILKNIECDVVSGILVEFVDHILWIYLQLF